MSIDWTKPIETVGGLPATVSNHHSNGAMVRVKPTDGYDSWGPWAYESDGTVGNDWLPDLRNVIAEDASNAA